MANTGIWTIPFRSHGRRNYEIRIGGMASSRTLTGGVPPITIDEDISDNFFEPVRTQTGEMRYWDESGTLWRNLVPTKPAQHSVRLVRTVGTTETLIWQGYIAPQTFSGSMTQDRCNRSLACYCPLSHTEGQYLQYDATGSGQYHADSYYGRIAPSVAWYLLKILMASGGQWDNMYFQVGSGGITEWLNVRINYEVFFDEQHNPKYNNLEVLRYICTFFGWQCHMHGSDLYFLSPADVETRSEGLAHVAGLVELQSIAQSNIDPQNLPVAYSQIDLGDYTDYFANTNQRRLIVPGLSRCTVTGEVDPREEFLAIPTKAIEEAARNVAAAGGARIGDGWFYYKDITQTGFEDSDMSLDVLNNYWGQTYGGAIEIRDISQNTEHDNPPKRNFNSEGPLFRIPYGNQQQQATYLLAAKQGVAFPAGGILVISATVWEDYFPSSSQHDVFPATGNLYVSLLVGNKYWNGSAWATHTGSQIPASFTIPTGTEDPSTTTGKGKIKNTRTISEDSTGHYPEPYPAYDGYGIPITSAMSGYICLWIFGDDATAHGNGVNNSGLRMNNISIKYYENNASPLYTEESTNVHERSSSTAFTEEANFSIPFTAWDNNQYGRGLLLQANGGYCDSLHYGQTSENPEQHLADLVAVFGKSAREQLETELLLNVFPDITPRDFILTDSDYYPVARSWDWYEEIIKIKAIEIS